MPKLHHSAYKITTGNLETVLDMFKLLDCKVTYRPKNEYQWAMIGQDGLAYDIQLVEHDEDSAVTDDKKTGTHLAFISKNPDEDIKKVEAWANNHDIKFSKGQWSDKELYFDLPDIFINFVVEVMHTSIEDT